MNNSVLVPWIPYDIHIYAVVLPGTKLHSSSNKPRIRVPENDIRAKQSLRPSSTTATLMSLIKNGEMDFTRRLQANAWSRKIGGKAGQIHAEYAV